MLEAFFRLKFSDVVGIVVVFAAATFLAAAFAFNAFLLFKFLSALLSAASFMGRLKTGFSTLSSRFRWKSSDWRCDEALDWRCEDSFGREIGAREED